MSAERTADSLHVGYVVKRFPRLSETFILNELRALRRLGATVSVFSLLPPEPDQQHHLLEELDLPVHYLPEREQVLELVLERRNWARGKTRRRNLRRTLRQEAAERARPPFPGKRFSQCAQLHLQSATLASLAAAMGLDHLHAHFASDAATVAMLASRLSGIPFSMTAHAKDIYHVYSDPERDRAFLRRKLREARFTVTVSDYNRAHLQQLGGPDAVVHRLYNGVDLERLRWHEGPRMPHRILGVGRLVEKKGFRHLVEACRLLQQRNLPFHCRIIGDGPERNSLERQIREAGLEDRVRLEGARPQTEVFRALREATLFALPCVVGRSGDRDGLPTVILECMALGTPVVTTRVAGIPEMIEHGRSGWLAEPGDPRQLADLLEAALTAAPEARRRVALEARRRAERLFDLHENAARLYRYFTGETETPGMARMEMRR